VVTGGIFVLPTLLKKAKKIMTEEILLISSLALCLGMVVLATVVGFSAELGAFVMGSIIAETTSAEKIEHLLKPVKDLFGAIFFTSVGMMIDPANMVAYAQPIFYVTLLTLFGKLISTTVGALLSGQPLKQSVQVGMSMAQIGEFAFIVATLGLSLGVTSAFLFPVAVGASAITTFTTPYLIKLSGPLYQWLEKVLPARLINRINKYSSESRNVAATSEWRQFIRSTLINVVLFSIIIIAIIIFSSNYIEPWIIKNGDSLTLKIAVCLLALLVLSPFLWALAVRTPRDVYKKMMDDNRFKGTFYVVRLVRLALVAFYIGFLLHRFFNLYTGIVFTAVTLLLLLIFSKKIQVLYAKLEHRFVSNLNEREVETSRLNRTELAPWDAHIVPVVVPVRAACIGKTLLELKWREMIGVNVVMIKREDYQIALPGREQVIYPNDTLLVLGTDHQVQRLKVLIRAEEEPVQQNMNDVALFNYFIGDNDALAGKTIRTSGLRDKANALVVGIERNNDRILNPESDTVLQANDNLFIVGDPRQIKALLLQSK
jgi:CPA2 family monovalent cation:H+ antiporter-2